MTTTCDVWLCVDAAGDFGFGADEDAAREHYEESIGELNAADGFRLVRVTVTVPLPQPIEVAVAAPADEPAAGATAK